jgi:type I restriction enzyme S subunit
MMSEWKKVSVSDLGRIVTGKTPKTAISEYYGGCIPFLTPSDDMSVKYVLSTSKTITEDGKNSVKNAVIPKNSICVSCIGSDLGKVVITTKETVTNQQINSVIVNTELYDVDFVYYAMVILGKVLNYHSKTSTAVPIVNKSTFSQYEILCPVLSEQRKIARILSEIDSKIAINTAINENLEQQAQALFKNLIADIQERVPFTSVIQVLGGGTPKTGKQEYWNGEIPFFTPKDVGAPYVLTTEKSITPLGLDNCNSRLYPVNTVFLTARGTVGKVSLAGVPMSMNQSCYALAGKDGLHQIIVYHYVLETVKALKHKASGAVFDAIITRDFDTESVPALSSEQIDSFIAVAEPIYSDILNRTIENQRLAALRDTLLPKLMNGEIDVSAVQI